MDIARILAKARAAVALTGAGISVESGMPAFRGPGGLWERYRPEELVTPQAFARDPQLVWRWYKWRQEIIYNAKPNSGHYALAELEAMDVLRAIITQNVDGLHQRAGSREVVELHGSIWRVKCTKCGAKYRLEKPVEEIPPKCPQCGGLLRPDVVWFGEPLPEEAWREAYTLAVHADVMLVVGTSGVVYPAALLPRVAKEAGAFIVEINVEESAVTPLADIFIKGKAGEELPKIVQEVRRWAT